MKMHKYKLYNSMNYYNVKSRCNMSVPIKKWNITRTQKPPFPNYFILLPRDNQYPEFKHCRSGFKIYMNEITQYVFFYGWLLLFNALFVRFLNVVCSSDLFILIAAKYSII